MDVDNTQMTEWVEKLEKLASEDKEQIFDATLTDVGRRFLAKVKMRTPVSPGGGQLRRGWSEGNTKTEHSGSTYSITITNPVEYAEYVEYGHRQHVGQFVPGLGEDGKGRRLVKPWVEGQFFTTRTSEEMRPDFEQIIQKRLNKWLEGEME